MGMLSNRGDIYGNTNGSLFLAKNEEQHMKECIASAQFADEVLLIDDGSTDKTVEIAESMGLASYITL